MRWNGQVQPAYSETYTFYTTSDDGVRLWINGVQIIDDWTNHAPVENSATVTLVGGQRYDIRLEYFEAIGGAVARLEWSSASQSRQIIPADRLYPSTGFQISGKIIYGATNAGQPDSFVTGVNLNTIGTFLTSALSDSSGSISRCSMIRLFCSLPFRPAAMSGR